MFKPEAIPHTLARPSPKFGLDWSRPRANFPEALAMHVDQWQLQSARTSVRKSRHQPFQQALLRFWPVSVANSAKHRSR